MRPKAVQLIVDVIGEVNRKNGGIAVKLKDVLSVEEIADRTGLTVERVKELIS